MQSTQDIERYIRNELGATETEQFEQRLLWDTELQQQYELTVRMRDALRDSASDKQKPVHFRPSFWASPAYAAAATVLLGITTTGWLMSALSPGSGEIQISSSRVYSLESVRSANLDDLALVSPGPDGEWLTLLVYPDLSSAPAFRAVIARLSGPPHATEESWRDVWQGPPTTSGDGDTVAVTVPDKLLQPGIHRLRIIDADGPQGAILGEVYFEVPGR